MRDRRGSHGLFPKHKLALPPRMMELDEDPGAILMHRIHESFETLEVTAMAGGQLVRLTHSGAVEDAAQTTDDKSDPTLRPRLVKGNGIVIDAPARRGEVETHGGHGHAVLDLQTTDLDRAEQIVIHGMAPFP